MEKRNLIAQWAFDTRPILGRFHLWLDDVEIEWLDNKGHIELRHDISFAGDAMERLFIMTAAVTALGTRLFGRYGEGKGKDKKELNHIKKDADAVSAYIMSESLWYLTRQLPENHAVMVCLGEGLMPKGGESPDMGSNPLLGFGRVYARPQVAVFLDRMVQRLINNPDFGWDDFTERVKKEGVTVWGAAIDTLENTSRFAKGAETGPMTVLHLFDQPLSITRPYEGYMGNLILPREVVENAAKESLLVKYHTPRSRVMEAIRLTYPDIKPEHVHVWTLAGPTRVNRIGTLWKQWRDTGAHIVEEGYTLPTGYQVFTDSGTYAPTYQVGTWFDEAGDRHLFLVDGYAATAEAMQAASLAPILNVDVSLALFSSKFNLSWDVETKIMHLDPDDKEFIKKLFALAGQPVGREQIELYRQCICEAREAGMDVKKKWLAAKDFMPDKKWDVMALAGYMLDDPYTGAPGVQKIDKDTYRVSVRLSTPRGMKQVCLSLRFMEPEKDRPLVCNPLLIRFFNGEDYENRAVKISDSGRIRNELQTLCSEAMEFFGVNGMRVHFNRIPDDVISPENQVLLRKILTWYKTHHPLWFSWLEIAD
ncbi:MAG TPA: hypothetical protein ENN03_11590 [bacterium]|nr:hypothetical protein [bacterium]